MYLRLRQLESPTTACGLEQLLAYSRCTRPRFYQPTAGAGCRPQAEHRGRLRHRARPAGRAHLRALLPRRHLRRARLPAPHRSARAVNVGDHGRAAHPSATRSSSSAATSRCTTTSSSSSRSSTRPGIKRRRLHRRRQRLRRQPELLLPGHAEGLAAECLSIRQHHSDKTATRSALLVRLRPPLVLAHRSAALRVGYPDHQDPPDDQSVIFEFTIGNFF